MDPAELLKPINDRPIAALVIDGPLRVHEWGGLIVWLQAHGRRVVVLVDGRTSVELLRVADLFLPLGALSRDEVAELIFWCCLCIGTEGPILDAAREKAVPVIVADASPVVLASRIEALWKRQDEEARALADV